MKYLKTFETINNSFYKEISDEEWDNFEESKMKMKILEDIYGDKFGITKDSIYYKKICIYFLLKALFFCFWSSQNIVNSLQMIQ